MRREELMRFVHQHNQKRFESGGMRLRKCRDDLSNIH